MALKKISGIYKIEHVCSGRFYVGSAVDIKARWSVHKHDLAKGLHHSRKLQNIWNKYGEGSFNFLIVEVVDEKNKLIAAEQTWIDAAFVSGKCLNISETAGSPLGIKRSDETKAKLSALNLGKKLSVETRQKMSESRTGGKMSRESVEKSSKTRTGKKRSAESRLKMSVACKGRVASLETRAKMSIARKAYCARKKSAAENAHAE